jgi:alpha-beta hydrolase superfamily lysophospholipase
MSSMFVLLSWISGAFAGPVQLTTADGVTLAGEDWGQGTRGILLVHDAGRSRTDWSTIAPKLGNAGFHVLAIDLRGHGGSKLAAPLAEADWPKLVQDVTAGAAWLRQTGVTEIHLVGAHLGANLGMNAAVTDPTLIDLVLLSPSLNIHGVKVSSTVAPLGTRSLLVATSDDDPMALKTATWLVEQASGPKHLATFSRAGTGARMLNVAPDL